MYACDGVSTHLIEPGAETYGTSFTIAIWLQTTTTLIQTLFGFGQSSPPGSIHVKLNCNELGSFLSGSTVVGKTSIRLRGDFGGQYVAAITGLLYDGNPRILVIRRSGSTVDLFVDPGPGGLWFGTVDVGTNSLGASEMISLQGPMAMGARNRSTGPTAYGAASIGEFAIWQHALTFNEIGFLGAGWSALHLEPHRYWRGLDLIEELGGYLWINNGAVLAGHPQIFMPAGPTLSRLAANRTGVYEVFLSAGAPADPDVDFPIQRVKGDTNQVVLDVPSLSLQASTTYFLDVYPVNRNGRATASSRTSLRTDTQGKPLMRPSPVTGLRADPLAGGQVVVRWTYDELVGLALADQFRIELTPLSGQAAPGPVTVTHVAPRRDYTFTLGPLTEGLWRMHVFSEMAGDYEDQASGVDFRADATGPASSLTGLTAV